MNEIERLLFDTEALKVANENTPFWYTSGTIGPFYINTHYLYGGEKSANELLSFIDDNINKSSFTIDFQKRVVSFYKDNEIYKKSIDLFLDKLLNIKEFNEAKYISGGERRDWFFSVIVSYLTEKKHLYIYKDLRVFYNDGNKVSDINGNSVFHICDLITQASSFKRGWIPAINAVNGKLTFVGAIVDRDQGGVEYLKEEFINSFRMVKIDEDFLNDALASGLINNKQLKQILDFKNDPDVFGKNFILNNKDFLINSLNSEKDKAKAKRCVEENPYKIDFKNILK